MKIDHIVFDIGHVLLYWDPKLIYTDLIPDEKDRDAFIETVCDMDWNIEQDRGRDWRIAEDLLIADHPEKEHLIRAYRSNWNASVPYAYEDVGALMVSLVESGRDVTMLTNFNQETYPLVTERFGFFSAPRGGTVSGEVELVKPDRAIYDLHTKTFNLIPENTVFIDDSAPNIAAAREYGWNAIHFNGSQGADYLAQKLAEFGVE